MGKSVLARIASLYFRMLPKYTDEQWKKRIEGMKTKKELSPRVPRNIAFRIETSSLGHVFYLNENNSSEATVFYMHGGGYIHDISRFHWMFIKKIIKRTDAEVIVPAYRLVPYATYSEAFRLIIPLYSEYRKNHPKRKLIFMGDSAGGGLALALAEYCRYEKIPAPDELVLFSPWVDVSMSNPDIGDYEKRDPWITLSFRTPGSYWAGDKDTKDWMISPLYGNVEEMDHITLFTGTEEILYPDMMLLYDKMKKGAFNEMITGTGMNHVYPILPIPEADAAISHICDIVMRTETEP